MTLTDLELRLSEFTGTTQYYLHPYGLLFTDGVKFLADEAKSYWLIDLIASYQPYLKKGRFQL